MQLEYICHSCVTVRTSDATLVFDPWIDGPAYRGQWHIFPKPVDIAPVLEAEHVLLTHGHEDHMHRRSLELLRRTTRIFFPYQWREGITGYLSHLGFDRVTEAVTLKRYQVAPNTVVTYLAYSLESIVVIEADGEVLVNLNDALNSNHENVVAMFLDEVGRRWPRIDILLSGMSGAGYFPNQVKYPGKDDAEVGRVREQYFAHHLCNYIHRLKPKMAVPFAPGFALLEKDNRWINEVKFPREQLPEYYAEHFADGGEVPEIASLYPGDRIDGVTVDHRSPYGALVKNGSLSHLIDAQFASEIDAATEVTFYPEDRLHALRTRTAMLMNANARLYDQRVLEDARFSLRFTDVAEAPAWNVRFTGGRFAIAEGSPTASDSQVIITTRAELLEHAVDRAWGADAMTIGYGLTVEVFTEDALEKNLDIVCVRLISRYPIMRDDLWRQPLRALRYFATNPKITGLHLKQKLTLRPYVNKYPYNERDHWISYSKCDLCRVCRIPELQYRA